MTPVIEKIALVETPFGKAIQADFSNDRHHITSAIEGNPEAVAYILLELAKAILKDPMLATK